MVARFWMVLNLMLFHTLATKSILFMIITSNAKNTLLWSFIYHFGTLENLFFQLGWSIATFSLLVLQYTFSNIFSNFYVAGCHWEISY